MGAFKFIKDMFTGKCHCGEKAVEFPHGVPCCADCTHEADCSAWLGDDECDCGKDEERRRAQEEKKEAEDN